jgi:hypothetical protein
VLRHSPQLQQKQKLLLPLHQRQKEHKYLSFSLYRTTPIHSAIVAALQTSLHLQTKHHLSFSLAAIEQSTGHRIKRGLAED